MIGGADEVRRGAAGVTLHAAPKSVWGRPHTSLSITASWDKNFAGVGAGNCLKLPRGKLGQEFRWSWSWKIASNCLEASWGKNFAGVGAGKLPQIASRQAGARISPAIWAGSLAHRSHPCRLHSSVNEPDGPVPASSWRPTISCTPSPRPVPCRCNVTRRSRDPERLRTPFRSDQASRGELFDGGLGIGWNVPSVREHEVALGPRMVSEDGTFHRPTRCRNAIQPD